MRYNGKTDSSTIAARVRELGFALYADYLASDHWQDVRRRYYAVNSTQCGCGAKAVALHHKTYERLGAERLEDLEAVCNKCHRERHRRRASAQKKKAKRQRQRLRKKRSVAAKPMATKGRGYRRGEGKGGSSKLTYHP